MRQDEFQPGEACLVPHVGGIFDDVMCLGMLMPDPRHPGGGASLPTIQRAWNIAPDEMSWIRAFAMTLGTLSVGKDPQ
jgi:hypothetical protein